MKPGVLVTGGAGFIGAHACKWLAEAGVRPIVLDNLSTGHADAVKWGPLVRADVRDRDAVAKALRDHRVQTVMHFAASAYVGQSMQDPALYYDNNVAGMIGLLAACRDTGVRQVVLSSSCATYGTPDHLPITENTPQRPINPYGWTKLICEQMLADHARAYGVSYVALRYFNAAGADPDGMLRERHDPETHLIPLALMAAAGQIERLDVMGGDYDTPDGTCIRDYIHVADLAAAHVAAWRHVQASGPGAALSVNLGTGQGASVLEVIETVQKVTGRRVPYVMRDRRPGDPAILLADASKAQQSLGFAPKWPNLAAMVRDAAPGFGLEVRDAKHLQRT
ncbi:UDP-glucose 4-epimerase GalE [Roseovarius gahaiensis]|uniref:UDP-glucose 4-epimerase n=1 Tax=Roseovarius gahaiensis TaxID=2716691 RepID=A0A967BCC7_9RHOB|nr:UDP-glucose 4-epimerase GalE [Roseovarius gahaiensis]NHQ73446.1 UDP-glucose 4-epimerase GalE [Roseovarius gahaiensis]